MEVISVVMPTYNAEKWVVATIDNLAAQTYPHIELIVVDDGSSDATVATVREKLSGGLPIDGRIIELGVNAGPSAARNIGLRAATGSWVQFLDSDDFLAPTKFERQMQHCLNAPSDVSAVYSAWRRCYYDAGDIVMEGNLATPRDPAQEPVMCLVGIDRPLLGSGIVRRAALKTLGGFDESLRFWECEEMFARLAQAGRLEVVASNEPFYLWRMHRDKIYIGDDSARYRSTAVALSWMELVRKQTSGRLLDELRLTGAERAKLLDDCTVWARILYSRDRLAFRQFVAMAKQLQPSIAPTHPRFATLLSRVLGYEAAEGVARLGRIPRALKNKAFGRRATAFDWK